MSALCPPFSGGACPARSAPATHGSGTLCTDPPIPVCPPTDPAAKRNHRRGRGGTRRASSSAKRITPKLLGFVAVLLAGAGAAAGETTVHLSASAGPDAGAAPYSAAQLTVDVTDAPPHHPRGCVAQAWSVAEVLRAMRLVDEKLRRQ